MTLSYFCASMGVDFCANVHVCANNSRVLGGDRGAYIRYLNPHLVSVFTESLEDGVTVYVIDGSNGQIVETSRHRNARQPVTAVLAHNTLVYQFWNQKTFRPFL